MLQGIAEEAKKEEQRINSRFNMYVPEHSQFSIEEFSKASTLWPLCRITEAQDSNRFLGFRNETQSRNGRGALPRLEDEQCHMRMHEQGYSKELITQAFSR